MVLPVLFLATHGWVSSQRWSGHPPTLASTDSTLRTRILSSDSGDGNILMDPCPGEKSLRIHSVSCVIVDEEAADTCAGLHPDFIVWGTLSKERNQGPPAI